jgi:hypothetical protein
LLTLGLHGDQAEKWSRYVDKLCSNFIRLFKDDPDSLVWSKKSSIGDFTAKLGYFIQAKRDWSGPNRYSLSKQNVESVTHIFVDCPLAGPKWTIVSKISSQKFVGRTLV